MSMWEREKIHGAKIESRSVDRIKVESTSEGFARGLLEYYVLLISCLEKEKKWKVEKLDYCLLFTKSTRWMICIIITDFEQPEQRTLEDTEDRGMKRSLPVSIYAIF